MARSLTVLIAGGTGMIGTALTTELEQAGHKVLLLSRTPGAQRIVWNPESTPLDLDSIADLQKLPALLRARGYSEDDITGILSENFLRFLRTALP